MSSAIKLPYILHFAAAGDIARRLKDDLTQAVHDAEQTLCEDNRHIQRLEMELEGLQQKREQSIAILEYARQIKAQADRDPRASEY